MTPDITIVIPNYNMQQYLGLALESVLDQTLRNLEVIVVDDASTDDSVELVEKVQEIDSRVHLLIHEENKGKSAARNTGIRNAKSRYVALLDSDDLYAPERCQILFSRLEAEREPGVVYSDSIEVDPVQTQLVARQSTASYRPAGMIFPQILGGEFRFTIGTIALHRSCFDEVGFYDSTFRYAQDLDMALRLSSRFPFWFERLSTYGWRSHQASSSIAMEEAKRMKYEARVLERHLFDNLDDLDSNTKRKAFNRLLGCYVGSEQWMKLILTGFSDWQAFISLTTLPRRMRRLRP